VGFDGEMKFKGMARDVEKELVMRRASEGLIRERDRSKG